MPAKTTKNFRGTKMYEGARPPVRGGVEVPPPGMALPKRKSGAAGVGPGYGFGSGHAGHRRKGGPHPNAPKNG
jgi:hypothetical protein